MQRTYIRWMIWQDLPEVIELAKQNPELQWSEQELTDRAKQRDTIAMIAERNDQIVGFTMYELHPNRLHITNMVVDQKYRREGIGRTIMEKLISKLDAERRNRITLLTSESNLIFQQFLRAMGFRAVQIVRNTNSEDMYSMRYAINSEVTSLKE